MCGQKAWDIVGYTFQADNYCPGCIIDQLPTGPGQPYDETTFDSGDFPKVIFSSQLEDTEHCGACGWEL